MSETETDRERGRVMRAILAARKLDTIYGVGFARENARNFWPRNPTPSLLLPHPLACLPPCVFVCLSTLSTFNF